MTIQNLGNGTAWNTGQPTDYVEEVEPQPIPVDPKKKAAIMKKNKALFRILKHSCETNDIETVSIIMEECTAILYEAVTSAIKNATEVDL